jgi:hyaluronan synthase
VLQEGYHVTFQSNAIVYTNVPVQYDKRCKMDLRWARSDLRKWVVMGAFMFKDFRPTPTPLTNRPAA